MKVYNKKNSNLTSNDISDLLIDSKKRLWITTLGGGLNYYNAMNDTFEVFKSTENMLSSHVTTVIEDSKGQIWLGTEKGLCKLNTDTNTFISFTNELNIGQSKKSNNIILPRVFIKKIKKCIQYSLLLSWVHKKSL